MHANASHREIGEKTVLLLFFAGSAILAGLLSAADGYLERKTSEDGLRTSASALAARPRRKAAAESREPGPAPHAHYRLSAAERRAYFSLVAALDIQGKPEELAPMFMGTIRQESSFNPRAEHPVSGAKGLSQLMDGTGAAYGLSRADLFEPVPNLQAFVEYFYDNVERFTNASGIDSTGKRATITRDEAIKYSLIAHNLGPTALEALLGRGFGEQRADGFVRLLEQRIRGNAPVTYHNRYSGRDDVVTVSKMVEVVGFYHRIMAYSRIYRDVLSADEDGAPAQQVALR
jgi:hypothetical protein